MNKLIISIIVLVALLTGYGIGAYAHIQKKYKMNLAMLLLTLRWRMLAIRLLLPMN